jgi:hypothetical protein
LHYLLVAEEQPTIRNNDCLYNKAGLRGNSHEEITIAGKPVCPGIAGTGFTQRGVQASTDIFPVILRMMITPGMILTQ